MAANRKLDTNKIKGVAGSELVMEKPTLLDVLKFIWLLPATLLVWAFYIAPLVLTGNIIPDGKLKPFVWAFRLAKKDSWWASKWKDWYGWSGPCVVIYRDSLPGTGHFISILRHELRHCEQQANWGLFFYPAYALNSLYIYFFMRDKHVYYFNWFERDAREYAGQRVIIPRDEWMHGPNDRIPWF